ncbi:hypothetical protein O181_059331 [Austropuccinia psidii MF-1]|uniref:Uncharacterized protein n=1 Tax=Austropuccinia psidii MF-1 TaxID=1389203 RepID=A0A9Q3EC07_9BASI|nr:hypothetical protein [Austropuccinia psidii MF-1]
MAQKGHLGLNPPNERGCPKARDVGEGAWRPLEDKRTPPGPKSKIKGWGLVMWKLAKEANDGRIWPEAMNDDGGQDWPKEKVLWPNGHRALEGTN